MILLESLLRDFSVPALKQVLHAVEMKGLGFILIVEYCDQEILCPK